MRFERKTEGYEGERETPCWEAAPNHRLGRLSAELPEGAQETVIEGAHSGTTSQDDDPPPPPPP